MSPAVAADGRPEAVDPGGPSPGWAGERAPRPRRQPRTVAGVAAAVVALTAVTAAAVWLLPHGGDAERSPFHRVRLYQRPDPRLTDAIRDAPPGRASLLGKIAGQPTAVWFGEWTPVGTVTARVAEVARAAATANAVPLFVVYALPFRDCGIGHSAGGVAEAADYRSWITAFAAGLDGARAFVVLEPDALSQLQCLVPARRAERLGLLKFAVQVLGSYPGVVSYLDAGHSHWIPPETMAERLRQAGVDGARGFALNVSFYGATADEASYGAAVSRRLGGRTRFVIDTSRNGAGPPDRGQGATNTWCNPPGRALGQPPLSDPPTPLVDALLWIKNPATSDGACGRGEPAAGVLWPERAADLAAAARW